MTTYNVQMVPSSEVKRDIAAPTVQVGFLTEAAAADRLAKWTWDSETPSPHTTLLYFSQFLQFRPYGSGINGPATADVGYGISAIKKNWTNSSAFTGEMDGLYIGVRQSGPDSAGGTTNSDATGVLIDLQNNGNCGYISGTEAVVSNVDRNTFAYTKRIAVQCGAINSLTGGQQSYGVVVTAHNGVNTEGLRVQEGASGSWTTAINVIQSSASVFSVSGEGDITGKKITLSPGASVTPTSNGQVVFELTNNTTLSVKAKGSDGVIRSVALTLA